MSPVESKASWQHVGASVYSPLEQKHVLAWLDLRNKAAHAEYDMYTKEQVALLLQGVKDFISQYPIQPI